MEGEHTPTIIQLIRSIYLAVIQLKDSYLFFIFPNKTGTQWIDPPLVKFGRSPGKLPVRATEEVRPLRLGAPI